METPRFKNAFGSEGVECVDEVWRVPLVTSTQGRCGAEGSIATETAMGLPTKAAGEYMVAAAVAAVAT